MTRPKLLTLKPKPLNPKNTTAMETIGSSWASEALQLPEVPNPTAPRTVLQDVSIYYIYYSLHCSSFLQNQLLIIFRIL